MIAKKGWHEFRDAGMLWIANTILHIFGWCIAYEFDKGEITSVYPARCAFRGFSDKCNADGYRRVNKYLLDNAEELYDESCN